MQFYLFDGGLLNVLSALPPGWPIARPESLRAELSALMQTMASGSVFPLPAERSAAGEQPPVGDTAGFYLALPLEWGPLDRELIHWAISRSLYAVLDRLCPVLAG